MLVTFIAMSVNKNVTVEELGYTAEEWERMSVRQQKEAIWEYLSNQGELRGALMWGELGLPLETEAVVFE